MPFEFIQIPANGQGSAKEELNKLLRGGRGQEIPMQATVYAKLSNRRLTPTISGSAVSFPAFVLGDKVPTLFPALRADALALSGASRRKQSPSSIGLPLIQSIQEFPVKIVCRISNCCLPCVAFIGRIANRSLLLGCVLYPALALGLITPAHAFEGRVTAVLTKGEDKQTFTYIVGPTTLRIERNETDRPYTGNLIALGTGDITLLFPHNRSFVRLKSPGGRAMPGGLPMSLPAGGLPPGIGPTNLPGLPDLSKPQIPQMPAGPAFPAGAGGGMPGPPMMPMPEEALEIKATGEKADFLGYACARYEIRQRGEIMEIWATDTLLPFQPYLQSQLPRFGPRMIEQQWGDLLKARKLFPLLATLKFEDGSERLRFEVKTVTPEKIADDNGTLFQPPASYHEVEPLPF